MLPLCFRFRAFPIRSASFRPLLFRFRLLSLPLFLFPSSRFPLAAVPTVHISSSVRPVAMPSFRFRYSALCNSFLRPLFRFTEATTAPRPLRSISLGLRFRCRILSHLNSLFREFCSFIHLTRQKQIYLYYHTNFHLSTLFSKFFEKFFIFCFETEKSFNIYKIFPTRELTVRTVTI